MVNLNVTWLGYVFVLISFVHMQGAIVFPLFHGKTLDVDGQESVGLENWTIFMDVIRVSPLTSSLLKVRGSSSLFPPYFPF